MQRTPQSTETYQHQLRATFYVFLIISSIIFSVEAMSAETASILPKKISRFRVVGVQTELITDQINSNGQLDSITSGLNRSITAADLAKSDKSGQVQKLINGLKQIDQKAGTNFATSLFDANIYSHFDMRASQVMPCYEYGVSEKFNVGIRVPVVHRAVHASFSSSGTNGANSIRSLSRNLSQDLSNGLQQFANAAPDPSGFSNTLFVSKGYEVPHDFDDTHLGDMELGGKYLYHSSDHHVGSIQTGLRVPTGSRKSRTNIFDTGTGNGTWATGVYLFNDFYLNKRWIIGTALKGIYNLPDHFSAAVPKDADDSLPSNRPEDGQVQDVNRVSGMEYDGELSTTVKLFHEAVYPWLAYQYAQHGRDSYSGPGNLYYEGLSTGTDYVKHAWEVGAGYSTVPAFVAKKAKIPYSIEGLFNHTFAGRNTTYVSYVRLDLIAYF